MAQKALFFSTSGVGDGASPYTQAELTDWLRRTFLNAPASQGVIPGFANQLAVSGAASPLTIATGAAMVYGFPYENTTSFTLTVPASAVGTTGHRIVLRASWAAQTVRVALLSSTDGVSAIPALTQIAGTTWEISLATLTRATTGAVTLTDAREYAAINADARADSIDDLKAGNRVPQFYRRQGSASATHWGEGGTTNHIPGAVRIQAGESSFTIPVGSQSIEQTITFPVPFSGYPLVFANASDIFASASGKAATATAYGNGTSAATSMLIRAARPEGQATTSTYSGSVTWLAVGPE